MLTVRRGVDRGRTQSYWLDSRHVFSFGRYFDPHQMGYRSLRVINEDTVLPGKGFATHPHRDMEILTWVLSGALEHRDSLGSGSVIRPGELQRMTAGTGITHSEFNHSDLEPVHFLQVWIIPRQGSLAPEYEQKTFLPGAMADELLLVASPDGRRNSITIHQDVLLYAAALQSGRKTTYELGKDRHFWIQVTGGELLVNDIRLDAGDGAFGSGPTSVEIHSGQSGIFLLFDLN